ncbi:DISARM system phospholipase D-like protein DrmC [Nocardiopsis kunsanensis]|uniref:DISARM system phospholipase D-like protein DrmC n=1 Tax=Nocardiopsis kunsanensis TaxID=141693 RepID=UPI000348A275|nr:DISARM system phospholipase D-like protein DrmC [Nocardiopsis kunsanensis]
MTIPADRPPFEEAAAAAAPRLGAAGLRAVATRMAEGWPDQAVLGAVRDRETVAPVLAAAAQEEIAPAEAAAYLRGLAAGHSAASEAVTVETVWTGPSTHAVPVRATAQVLVELVESAEHELVLMTYSATRHRRVREALGAAAGRGVAVSVVVETAAGAQGTLGGREPGAAFAGVGGLRLWHWPVEGRPNRYARSHAKIAVADRRSLLVSSANLTQSGVERSIEAGLLVRGGAVPVRVAEHVAELQARGVLVPLKAGAGDE